MEQQKKYNHMDFYDPPQYFTKELLVEEFEKFFWPDNYELIVDGFGINIIFPKCKIYFEEGFEGNMSSTIFDVSINDKYWDTFDLVYYVYGALKEKSEFFIKPKYIEINEGFSSKEKVRKGVFNLCLRIQFYLIDCVNGNFKAIYDYEKNNFIGLKNS